MLPFGHPFTVGYEAVFEDGTITYHEDGYKDTVETSFHLYIDQRMEHINIVNRNCYEETFRHVIECCEQDMPTKLSLTAAIESLKLSVKIKEQILKN
ncbi:hypothetical protein [Gracilibacillus alcaliphilus]|uniref:hypothetical protein n=1 Tax=Gracilibacillus alcaliphilus TaxID=1401441 RepID=UPI00195B4062|nr:hypothetical protein [Gracilibacillus alcaliphilus]MBM7679317.1 hypothetical protein [Gracilibacillus alcaliphilus]